ncbi:hypothetical protein ElyMa_003154400 [Elysia marginata]|uniref:Uncharacterized protein n=1 Tax=Elysia marginata TaxID=1093978 RepID=A0AAV4IWJ5_9GAST|nr:hypothetical protein ElyMa_003154400 [Elysia marginata]
MQCIGRPLIGSFHDDSVGDATSPLSDLNDKDDEESLPCQSQVSDDSRPTTPITTNKRPSTSNVQQSCSTKKKQQMKHTEQFLELEREKLDNIKHLVRHDEPKDEWRAYVDSLVHDLRVIINHIQMQKKVTMVLH